MMSDLMKGTVSLFVMIAWFLVYGASFSEAIERFQKVIEAPDEPVEQALSIDVSPHVDVTVILESIQIANVSLVNHHHASFIFVHSIDCRQHVPTCGPRLFKRLSIYRI